MKTQKDAHFTVPYGNNAFSVVFDVLFLNLEHIPLVQEFNFLDKVLCSSSISSSIRSLLNKQLESMSSPSVQFLNHIALSSLFNRRSVLVVRSGFGSTHKHSSRPRLFSRSWFPTAGTFALSFLAENVAYSQGERKHDRA